MNCINATTKQAYAYGADGNRVLVTKGTAKTHEFVGADGNQLIELEAATNKHTDFIYLGNTRIAQKEKTGTAAAVVSYLHNDLLGSPILSTNAAGAVLWKETYQPYGAPHVKSVGKVGRQTGYVGKPYDEATGLSYLGARYYNPVLGRFMSVDPVDLDVGNVHSLNRYHYSYNNPYMYKDETGETPKVILLPVVLKISDMGLTALDAYNAYQTGGVSAVIRSTMQDIPLQMIPGGKTSKHIVKKLSDQKLTKPDTGLGNPFKNATIEEVEQAFIRKGFIPSGPNPSAGLGGWINPKTGRSYHLDDSSFHTNNTEPSHIDVNRKTIDKSTKKMQSARHADGTIMKKKKFFTKQN